MVEVGTLCIQADVAKMAGVNASATSVAEAYTNVYILMAEGFICAKSAYDWVTNYATVSTIGKEALRDATASYTAIRVLNYDLSGFTSRTEAQTMLDILHAIFADAMNVIKEEAGREFIKRGVTT